MSSKRPIIIILALALVMLLVYYRGNPVPIFDLILLQPLLNLLVLLTKVFFGNFGLAIIALTVVILVITAPLTRSQLRSSRAMQEVQPKIKELQKKYGKDKERMSQETMKLYKESGVNPAGCMVSMMIQMPIWIALYQSVIQGLAYAPENLFGLSKQLYPWSAIHGMVPLDRHFLWLDLSQGDLIMGVLTGTSMWVLQKMSVQPSTDGQQQSMQTMMQWMMPLMFGFFALSFPSGLALYWVSSTLIRIVLQYRATGWGSLRVPSLGGLLPGKAGKPGGVPATTGSGKGSSGGVVTSQQGAAEADREVPEGSEAVGGGTTSQRRKVRDGKRGDKRKDRGRGRRPRSS